LRVCRLSLHVILFGKPNGFALPLGGTSFPSTRCRSRVVSALTFAKHN
jgi:hypothetical protein